MAYTKQIREFVSKKVKVTNKQIYAEFPELTHKQISMAMFNMKRKGIVEHAGFGKWKVLTPVNKTEPSAYKTAKTKEVADLRKRLEDASQEILHWHNLAKDAERTARELSVANHDLNEALVLIRYLERKLVTAIQFDARNNGNA